MAHVPNEEEVAHAQEQAAEADEEKRKDQQAQGKEFVNNGQGVMTEDEWKNYKEENNG